MLIDYLPGGDESGTDPMTIRFRYPRYVAVQPAQAAPRRDSAPSGDSHHDHWPCWMQLLNGPEPTTPSSRSTWPRRSAGSVPGRDRTAHGVGGSDVEVRFVDVRLRIADNQEHREWTARVGFAPLERTYALLGFAGFLQFFTATLYGDLEYVDLTVNALYPGT